MLVDGPGLPVMWSDSDYTGTNVRKTDSSIVMAGHSLSLLFWERRRVDILAIDCNLRFIFLKSLIYDSRR